MLYYATYHTNILLFLNHIVEEGIPTKGYENGLGTVTKVHRGLNVC